MTSVGGVVMLLALASFSTAGVQALQPRPVVGYTALENAYVHFANDLARSGPRGGYYAGPDTVETAAAICGKINPEAIELSVSWGGFDFWRQYYTQSDCFYQVAANGKAIELCDKIRELDAPAPKIHLSKTKERLLTRAECRAEASHHNASGGEYGTELMLLLLEYSREQITAGAKGRLPEEGGAYEFKSSLMNDYGDDGQDYKRVEELLRRVRRLPDFSRGDDTGRRQLDTLVPGWSSSSNTSRLGEALRCAVQRLTPGDVMSTACQDRF